MKPNRFVDNGLDGVELDVRKSGDQTPSDITPGRNKKPGIDSPDDFPFGQDSVNKFDPTKEPHPQDFTTGKKPTQITMANPDADSQPRDEHGLWIGGNGGHQKNNIGLTFYRGTTEDITQTIKQDGIKRGEHKWLGRPPSVYFTDDREVAERYGKVFSDPEGRGTRQGYAVIEFQMPTDMQGSVIVDEKDPHMFPGATNYRIEADIPASAITSVTVHKDASKKTYFAYILVETTKSTSMTKRELKPITTFQGPHPAQRGRGQTDAYALNEIWGWVGQRLKKNITVTAEPKWNGFRSIVQSDGQKVSIRFEGGGEKYPILSRADSQLARLGKLPSFIIDCNIGIVYKGERIAPRPDLMTLDSGTPHVPEGGRIQLTAFDILYWNKQSLNELPFSSRRKVLEKAESVLRGAGVDVTKSKDIKNKKDLASAWASKAFGSAPLMEGLVIKDGSWKYEPGPSTDGMIKIKHTLEVKAKVIEKKVAANNKVAYRGGLLLGDMVDKIKNVKPYGNRPYVDMGFSFNSDLKASEGDTMTFQVDEVIFNEVTHSLSWLGAVPLDVDRTRGPYAAGQVIDMGERSNTIQHTVAKTRMEKDGMITSDLPALTIQYSGRKKPGVAPIFQEPWPADKNYQPIPPLPDWDTEVANIFRAKPEEADKDFLGIPAEPRDGTGRHDKPKTTMDDPAITGFPGQLHNASDDEGGTHKEAATNSWRKNWQDQVPRSGTGRFVYQHHWPALTKDETKLDDHELMLQTDHAAHGDLRLEGDDALWGWSIFIGKMEDNKGLPHHDKLIDFGHLGEKKLQTQPKLPQPKDWLKVGVGKPTISQPGEAGVIGENNYAKFTALDTGTYHLGVCREHMFEIFLDGKVLKGRMIFGYAPVGDQGRIWLIDRDGKPYAQEHTLASTLKDVKSKGQKYLVWSDPDHKPIFIDVAKQGEDILARLDNGAEDWEALTPTHKVDKEANHAGAMLDIRVPMSVAYRVALKDEGAEPPEDMHITLTYFGDDVTLTQEERSKIVDVVQAVASVTRPFEIAIGDTATFTQPDESVVYASVKSAALLELRQNIITQLEHHGVEYSKDHPNYIPHITLKYVKNGEAAPKPTLTRESFTCQLVSATFSGQVIECPLFGVEPQYFRPKTPTAFDIKTQKSYYAEIIKADSRDEKRFTFGVVYKATEHIGDPELDAHAEFATADELQESLWDHVREGDRRVYVQHGMIRGVGYKEAGEWVELVSWPQEVKAELKLPGRATKVTKIPANSIWMGVIWQPWSWELVKAGKIRGYSFGGMAGRIAIE